MMDETMATNRMIEKSFKYEASSYLKIQFWFSRIEFGFIYYKFAEEEEEEA